MLTKDDLDSIGQVVSKKVREEVEAEGMNTRNGVGDNILSLKMSVLTDIGELANRLKNVEIRLNSLEEITKKGFGKMDKKFTDLFDFLDKDVMANKRKISRIEEKLQIQTV